MAEESADMLKSLCLRQQFSAVGKLLPANTQKRGFMKRVGGMKAHDRIEEAEAFANNFTDACDGERCTMQSYIEGERNSFGEALVRSPAAAKDKAYIPALTYAKRILDRFMAARRSLKRGLAPIFLQQLLVRWRQHITHYS